ncbi:MAG TPA: neutral zinc metallopeptidase [Pilimelia sp.]|nr:neutral zinc metallopeptidase [Pilimelia sp.]
MRLNENADIDTSQVEDRRGSGGGAGLGGLPIPIGGGRGGLVLTLVILALSLVGGGFGINALTGDDEGGGGSGGGLQACSGERPDLSRRDCRNVLYVNSIQDYWQDALPQHFGRPYEAAKTVFFSQQVRTGCGAADSGVGPFYCPPDRQVYIDLSFYDELARRFGADGEFAQPYVLAHEYGHHVQTVLGTEAQMRRAQQRDPAAANQLSVKLELQADCYAGVWAHHAARTTDAGGEPLFTSITDRDIAEGLEAAAAVGDDNIQRRSGGRIDESKFTHGSSADRQNWFRRGFDTGDPRRCDTFSGAR